MDKKFLDFKTTDELNEYWFNIFDDGIPTSVENSIYYPKLRHMLFPEINLFCKEKIDLKEDLNILRMNIGSQIPVEQIREYAEQLKAKYNMEDDNIGIEFHLEQTRIDYALIFFIMIGRGNRIDTKKFIFRFLKKTAAEGLEDLSSAGILKEHFRK